MDELMDLTELAKQAMYERHFLLEFSPEIQKEVNQISMSYPSTLNKGEDLRDILWFSIDNDDTRDIDQLTSAEHVEENLFKIYVAVADVEQYVKKNSAIDEHAQNNTTSVYTPTKVFPMLPEELSTDMTSLVEGEVRQAIVIEILVNGEGEIQSSHVSTGRVYNYAKLAYNNVAAWLDGKEELSDHSANPNKLKEQLRLHDQIAQKLRAFRHRQGALILDRTEVYSVIQDSQVVDIKVQKKNRAREIIEDFMIAANSATAKFLTQHQLPSLRRIVRQPAQWDQIVGLAKKKGFILPEEPDAKALNAFLSQQRSQLTTDQFSDLSLAVIKLVGEGEYAVDMPGQKPVGHFSLAVRDYIHSTAPNRRFPDLITQRLIKSALAKQPSPYTVDELEYLGGYCTEKENDADKVERRMRKSAVIFVLTPKIGQVFDGLITGAGPKGTWVRIQHPPAEGKIVEGYENLRVGDRVKVKLINLDLEKGFIDFVLI